MSKFNPNKREYDSIAQNLDQSLEAQKYKELLEFQQRFLKFQAKLNRLKNPEPLNHPKQGESLELKAQKVDKPDSTQSQIMWIRQYPNIIMMASDNENEGNSSDSDSDREGSGSGEGSSSSDNDGGDFWGNLFGGSDNNSSYESSSDYGGWSESEKQEVVDEYNSAVEAGWDSGPREWFAEREAASEIQEWKRTESEKYTESEIENNNQSSNDGSFETEQTWETVINPSTGEGFGNEFEFTVFQMTSETPFEVKEDGSMFGKRGNLFEAHANELSQKANEIIQNIEARKEALDQRNNQKLNELLTEQLQHNVTETLINIKEGGEVTVEMLAELTKAGVDISLEHAIWLTSGVVSIASSVFTGKPVMFSTPSSKSEPSPEQQAELNKQETEKQQGKAEYETQKDFEREQRAKVVQELENKIKIEKQKVDIRDRLIQESYQNELQTAKSKYEEVRAEVLAEMELESESELTQEFENDEVVTLEDIRAEVMAEMELEAEGNLDQNELEDDGQDNEEVEESAEDMMRRMREEVMAELDLELKESEENIQAKLIKQKFEKELGDWEYSIKNADLRNSSEVESIKEKLKLECEPLRAEFLVAKTEALSKLAEDYELSIISEKDYRDGISKWKSEGNFAIGHAKIQGLDKEYFEAFSNYTAYPKPGFSSNDNPGQGKFFFSDGVKNGRGSTRTSKFDTERAILNDIDTRLNGNTNASGEVTIYTELKPCTGCVQTRVDFQNTYPNIHITFIDQKGGVDFDIR